MVTLAAALILAAPQAGGVLPAHIKALSSAEQLSATYKVTKVGGASEKFSVQLARPNKARIESPTQILIADGNSVTVFMKSDKTYFKKAQTEDVLKGLFADRSLRLWLPFFDAQALKDASVKEGQDKRGMKTASGSYGGAAVTFFADKADGLIRQVQFDEKKLNQTETSILNTEAIALTGVADSLYSFVPPSGSKEINEADLLEAKWMKFEDAMSAAAATKKIIMVDFMADWCGPCKMMDKEVFQTSAFKDAVKGMLLSKVDVDREQATAQKYGIEAMPTVKFLKPDGSVLHEFVGYGGPAQVLAEIKKARSMAGI